SRAAVGAGCPCGARDGRGAGEIRAQLDCPAVMQVLMDYVMLGWWLAIAALAFVAVELAARASIRRRGQYYVLPPGLSLRLFPDRQVVPQLERATRFDVNSDGERGDEAPVSGNVYRVLVAGGSQPEG